MSDFNAPTMAAAALDAVCERCGSSVPAGASVCPQCGAPAGANAAAPANADLHADSPYRTVALDDAAPAPEPAPARSETPPPAPVADVFIPSSPAPADFVAAPPVDKKPNRLPWIIGGCCLVFVMVCCCCLVAVAGIVAVSGGL